MMKLTKSLPYYTDSNEKFQLARLPYSNPKYSLFVVLPQERDGVNIVLSNLNGSKLLSALNRAVETELQVTFR